MSKHDLMPYNIAACCPQALYVYRVLIHNFCRSLLPKALRLNMSSYHISITASCPKALCLTMSSYLISIAASYPHIPQLYPILLSSCTCCLSLLFPVSLSLLMSSQPLFHHFLLYSQFISLSPPAVLTICPYNPYLYPNLCPHNPHLLCS
jgi:hypothetical protein